MENWKPVVGFEGYYEVSDMGRVRSVDRYVNTGIRHSEKVHRKGRVLIPHTKRKGYLAVDLSKGNIVKTILVHRIVATAFLPKGENDTQVNHINCNTSDNRVTNLEWCTGEENRAHAKANNRYYSSRKQKVRCKQTGLVFESSYKAAEWLNATKYQNTKLVKSLASKIRAACLGMQKCAHGYTWEKV